MQAHLAKRVRPVSSIIGRGGAKIRQVTRRNPCSQHDGHLSTTIGPTCPQPMRPSMRARLHEYREPSENCIQLLPIPSSLSLSYSYTFVCTRKRTHRDTTCIRIQTKACPVIIALLGYWTPNHEVTTVSNRALLAPGAFTLVYVSINANYFASLLPNSNLSSLSTLLPSFFLPSPFAVSSLWFSTTIFFFFFFFFLGTKILKVFRPRFSWRKKRNETRRDIFLPPFRNLLLFLFLFFPSLIIIPLFIDPLASQAPNTSRQLHFQSNRYLAAILRIGTSIYASSLKRDTKRFYTPSGFISSLLGMHLGHRPSLNDTNGR